MEQFESIGVPGLIGVGLIAFSAAFYVGTVLPMRERADALIGDQQKLAQVLDTDTPQLRRPGEDKAYLPASGARSTANPIEIIRRLNAVAEKFAIDVERASYSIVDTGEERRIEIRLPASGTYAATRRYLREAVSVGRNGRIESIVFQRTSATDSVLGADVKLSFEIVSK